VTYPPDWLAELIPRYSLKLLKYAAYYNEGAIAVLVREVGCRSNLRNDSLSCRVQGIACKSFHGDFGASAVFEATTA
jgi:hypothetical protein